MTIIDFRSHLPKAPQATPELRDVLIIVHRREAQPGSIGQWLRANGYHLDIRCPRFGDPLPETLEQHAGAVVFGGPMSVNDTDDYIRRELDWLDVPLRENKPYLGVCLGAQMLAKHLGAPVGFHADGQVEIGYYAVEATAEGRRITAWPDQVYQWHCEGFGLPQGSVRLASGGAFENQAFRYGDAAFGVQFHPEMTLAMIHRWTTVARHRLTQPGARPKAEHIAAHCAHGPRVRNWLDRFMPLLLRSGSTSAAARTEKRTPALSA